MPNIKLHLSMLKRAICILVPVFLASGCTTGAYLKPEASTGTYSTENPSCGGNPEVLEFSLPKQNWLYLRVYARQTHAKGTSLMVSFWIRPWTGLATRPGLVSSATESDQRIATQRSTSDYVVSTSKNSVTVEFPDGTAQEFYVPTLRSPHHLGQRELTFWPSPVQIAPLDLDQFTVKFPRILVNDEELPLPPINFKKDPGGQFNMILNC